MKISLKNLHNFFLSKKKINFLNILNKRFTITDNSKSSINKNENNNLNQDLDSDDENGNQKKNEVYVWMSSVIPGKKKEDYSNRLVFSHEPTKIEYMDDKRPKEIFTGPRHHAIITEDGNLYTFGDGYRGILGHGHDMSVPFLRPKLVNYFAERNIKVKKVVLGETHTAVLSEDGDVYSWGWAGKLRGIFSFYKEYGYNGHADFRSKFSPEILSTLNDEGVKIKDICSGIKHSMILAENGDLYTWGKGTYGLNADGKNNSIKTPKKNDFFEKLRIKDPSNEIVKIDSADEFCGALTKRGSLYVWGKNDKGQLGTGAGIGIDYTESEKFPLLVKNLDGIKIVDFSCGDNTMLIKDAEGKLYKTGLKVDYTPTLIEITKEIKPRLFSCGNSYYAMITESNDVYQWGNLFNKARIEKRDDDMMLIKSNDLFSGKEILKISCKYRVAGAIVKEKI